MRDVEESDLHIALEDIERSDGHVSGTSAETTADCTGGKEGRRVHLDLAGSLGAGTTKFLVGDETPLLELAAGGAAAPSMVLSRPKDLCEVETVEEEE